MRSRYYRNPPKPQVRLVRGGRVIWSNPPGTVDDPHADDDPYGYVRHGQVGDVIEIRYPDGHVDRIPVALAKDYLFDLVRRRTLPPEDVAEVYGLEPEAAAAPVVQDINQALLMGTLGLGESGVPVSTQMEAEDLEDANRVAEELGTRTVDQAQSPPTRYHHVDRLLDRGRALLDHHRQDLEQVRLITAAQLALEDEPPTPDQWGWSPSPHRPDHQRPGGIWGTGGRGPAPPPPAPPPEARADPAPRRVPVEGDTIAEIDFDEAEYRGDGEGGVYYQAVRHRAAGRQARWFVSGVVDSGGFVEDLFTDDGPYWTEEEALEAGENAALEWCIENSVDWRDDDSEER